MTEQHPLLVSVGTIKVRLAKPVVPHEFFKITPYTNSSMKICFISDNFKKWFLSPSVSKKVDPDADSCRTPDVESGATEVVLRYRMLNKRSVDELIINELGGEAKSATTLTEFTACIQEQARGKNGALLTNYYRTNIFYVRDVSGILRTVHVHWNGRRWFVDAYSVGGPHEWDVGAQVFSRDS